jgi:hypothetical protein
MKLNTFDINMPNLRYIGAPVLIPSALDYTISIYLCVRELLSKYVVTSAMNIY